MTRTTVEIIEILQQQEEATVSEISSQIDVTEDTVSAILKELYHIQLVNRRLADENRSGAMGKAPYDYSLTHRSPLTDLEGGYPIHALQDIAVTGMDSPPKQLSPSEHVFEIFLLLADAVYHIREDRTTPASSVLAAAFNHLIYAYAQIGEGSTES